MKKCVGIWIDHEKALLVFIMDGKETITSIESNEEERLRLSGRSRSATAFGPQDVASERKWEERYKHQLCISPRIVQLFSKVRCDSQKYCNFTPLSGVKPIPAPPGEDSLQLSVWTWIL